MYRMYRASPKKQGRRAGFSLPELLVVLSLISILGAIATPALLTWLPRMELRAAGRELYSQMQNVRMEAIRANQSRAIFFDTANNRYVIHSSPGADLDWRTPADNTVLRTVSLAPPGGKNIKFGDEDLKDEGGGEVHSVLDSTEDIPDDGVSYANKTLVFNSRGGGDAGYVYLQPDNDKEKNPVIAVGTQASGVVFLKRWAGGGWK